MTISRFTSKKGTQGFTLIEVVFVITIFAIMASIVLFRFKDFGTKTALDNLAQDVALRIVQAQKSSTSGTLTPGLLGLDDASAPSYGVFFTAGAPGLPAAHEFTYYADQNHDGFFNSLGVCPPTAMIGNECLSVTSITTGDYVSNICHQYPFSGTPAYVSCNATGSAHVTFKRPFHDARMQGCSTAGTCTSPIIADTTYIELSSTIDPALKETIIVTALGQVRVATGAACTLAGTTC